MQTPEVGMLGHTPGLVEHLPQTMQGQLWVYILWKEEEIGRLLVGMQQLEQELVHWL